MKINLKLVGVAFLTLSGRCVTATTEYSGKVIKNVGAGIEEIGEYTNNYIQEWEKDYSYRNLTDQYVNYESEYDEETIWIDAVKESMVAEEFDYEQVEINDGIFEAAILIDKV